MERRLEGRTALVTGASRGIGAACAHALAAHGADVVLAARDEGALSAVAESVAARGCRASVVRTDVSDPVRVRDMVERTLAEFGRLDIAINNAASGSGRPTPLDETEVDAFDADLAVGLRGTFLAMRAEIPAMLRGGGGAIVNMSSTAAQWPVAGKAGYVAAKAGLEGLTRSAALDHAAHGVRINALAPGPVLTESLAHAGEAMRERVAASVPMGRLGQAAEIAEVAVWLCGPDAAFVTGAVLPVDGGLLAGMVPFAPPRTPTSA